MGFEAVAMIGEIVVEVDLIVVDLDKVSVGADEVVVVGFDVVVPVVVGFGVAIAVVSVDINEDNVVDVVEVVITDVAVLGWVGFKLTNTKIKVVNIIKKVSAEHKIKRKIAALGRAIMNCIQRLNEMALNHV